MSVQTALLIPAWLLLPGLALLFVLGGVRGVPRMRVLWESLLFSPVVIAAGLLIVSWGARQSLRVAAYVLLAASVAYIGLALLRRTGAGQRGAPVSLRQPGLIAVLLVFGGVALLSFLRPENQLSVHGISHGAYVEQIAIGYLPPENPVFAGEPARNYWAYHALYALLAETAKLPFYTVSALYQALTLLLYLCAVWLVCRRVLGARVAALMTPLAAFGLNLQGPVQALLAWLRGDLGATAGLGQVLGALGGSYLAPLVHGGIYVKFLTFNGFIFGLAYYAALLLFALERQRIKVAVLLVGLILLHPTTGIAALAAVGVGWLALEARDHFARGVPWSAGNLVRFATARAMLPVWASLIVPLVLTLPYVRELSTASQGFPFTVSMTTFGLRNFLGLHAVALLLFAIALFRLRRGWTPDLLFAAAVLAVQAALSMFLNLPGENQYKYLYLAALPLWLLIGAGLGRPGVYRTAGTAMLSLSAALATAGALTVGLAWALLPSWFQHRVPSHSNGLVAFSHAPGQSAAGAWLVRNAPRDALIVEDAKYCEDAVAGAVSGRRSYFVPCYLFTDGYRDLTARQADLKALFSDLHDIPVVRRIAAQRLGPVYVLVSDEQLGARAKALAEKLSVTPGFAPVFRQGNTTLFAFSG